MAQPETASLSYLLLDVAGTPCALPRSAAGERRLLLEVTLNDRPTGLIGEFIERDGRLLAAAAVLGAAWWLWERRVKATEARTGVAPMVDPALFRRASFTIGAAETTLFLATMPAVFAVTAVFLQQGLEFTALASGLATLPCAAVQAGLSPWAGARAASSSRPTARR